MRHAASFCRAHGVDALREGKLQLSVSGRYLRPEWRFSLRLLLRLDDLFILERITGARGLKALQPRFCGLVSKLAAVRH